MGNRANQKGLTLHNLDKAAPYYNPIASCSAACPAPSSMRRFIDHFDKAVDMMQKTFSQKMTCGSVNRKKRLEDRKRFSKSRRPADLLLRARIDRMAEALFDRAYEVTGTLQADAYVSEEPLPFAKKETGRLIQNLKPGDRWAQHTFDCAWFHVTGKIPPVHRGDHNVYLINIGGEGLIYQPDATPVQAVTCYASEYDYTLSLPVKRVVEDFSENGVVDFWIDAAANDLFGNLKNGARIGELSTAVCHGYCD